MGIIHKAIPLFFILLFFSKITWGQSWIDLYDSTEVYWNKDWDKCIVMLEKAIPLAEQDIGKENNNYAVLLNDLALSYWYVNDFDKASALFEETLTIKKQVLGPENPDYAATLLNIAGTYQQMGKKDQAGAKYEEALEIYGKRHENYTVALNNLGMLKASDGDFREAEKYFIKAIESEEVSAEKNNSDYASALNNLAGLYRKTGQYEKSENYYTKAREVYLDNYGKTPDYAKTTCNQGILYQVTGKLAEAEKLMLEALGIMTKHSSTDLTGYANVLNNLGSFYKTVGNYKAARKYYLESHEINNNELGTEAPGYATSLNNLADLEMAVSNFEEAEKLYLRAAEIYQNRYGTEHALYSGALNNLASLYRKMNNYKKAEALYQQALNIDKKVLGEQHPSYASTLGNLALLHIASGNNKEAQKLMEKSLSIQKTALDENHPLISNTLNNLAISYYTDEDPARAEPLFLRAINSQLNQINAFFPSMSEREKEAFYKTLKADLERFNTFAILRKEQDPSVLSHMYNYQLATKGLIFQATKKMRDNIMSSGDAGLIADYSNWRGLKDELAQHYRMPKASLEEKGIDLAALEQQVNSLEKSLSQRSALFAAQNEIQEYTWKDVQGQIKQNEAAVELIRFRDFEIRQNLEDSDSAGQLSPSLLYGWTDKVYYAALVVTADKPLPELILFENGNAMETKYLSYYKNAIKFGMDDDHSYKQYLQPILHSLSGIQKIYLSNDGVFHKMNLNAIRNPGTNSFVIDEIEIQLVTNTRDLIREQRSPNDSKSLVLIGDPTYHSGTAEILKSLPETRKEVDEINLMASRKNWNSKVYTGKGASEELVKNIHSPQVVHIATHGFFSDEVVNPDNKYPGDDNTLLFNAGLLLSGAGNTIYKQQKGLAVAPENEDGILTAYEAMNLKLDDTEMVVLSACETGLGEVRNGEGVYGLQRAFKVAGAQSVILSLWKVDDEATRKLFTYFYQDWLQTGNKRAAFKTAQSKLRIEYPSPYYWGAFIMVGE